MIAQTALRLASWTAGRRGGGLHADLISGKDRLIEDKYEQLREAEALVLARDRQVQQTEAQKAGLRSALDQAEAELARIKSSRSWRLVSRLGRLSGLAARLRARRRIRCAPAD